MPTPNLIVVSAMTFTAVFAVLAALAASMSLITLLFPVRAGTADATTTAAVTTAVAILLPGARVTRIEEEP